jgi:glucokinase
LNSFYLGLDIGGTNVRIVSYDDDTRQISNIKKYAFKKTGDPKDEIDHNIIELVRTVIGEESRPDKELRGIGLSLAALFDRKNGDITVWPNNRSWNSFPIKNYLMEKLNVPVLIEDDANSAALGEHLAGAGKGQNNLAYITISTGIGCGLILNNSLYIGANGWAGEIGHIRVIDDGPECSCGMRGCLQSVASGPAILKRFITLKRHQNSILSPEFDLKDVVNLAKEGDRDSIAAFAETAAYIGKVMAELVMILDIPLIIVGGGVSMAGDILLKPIKEILNNYLEQFNHNIRVVGSQLGDNCGVIGALSLIYRHLNHGKMVLR